MQASCSNELRLLAQAIGSTEIRKYPRALSDQRIRLNCFSVGVGLLAMRGNVQTLALVVFRNA